MRNLLSNYDFETWTEPNSAPEGWSLGGATSYYVACDVSSPLFGLNAARIWTGANSGSNAYLYQTFSLGYWAGRTISAGVWAWNDGGRGDLAYLYISDGVGVDASYHSGGGAWEWLNISLNVDPTSASALRIRLYSRARVNSVSTALFDGAVALEGSFVPQTPYPFENVSYRLGISSSDSIPLFPGEDYSLGLKQSRNRDRTAAGTVYEFLSGQYRRASLPVEYVPASYAAVVNSWWQSQAPLLFFVESGSPIATAVHSVMIMGKTAPLDEYNQPDYNMFRGTIPLEGY